MKPAGITAALTINPAAAQAAWDLTGNETIQSRLLGVCREYKKGRRRVTLSTLVTRHRSGAQSAEWLIHKNGRLVWRADAELFDGSSDEANAQFEAAIH